MEAGWPLNAQMQLGTITHTRPLAHGRLRQEEPELEVSLGYIVMPCRGKGKRNGEEVEERGERKELRRAGRRNVGGENITWSKIN